MATHDTIKRDDAVYCAGGSGVCGCHTQRTTRYTEQSQTERSRVSRFVRVLVAFGAIVYLLVVAFGCESTNLRVPEEATKETAWEHYAKRVFTSRRALPEILAQKPLIGPTGGLSLIHLQRWMAQSTFCRRSANRFRVVYRRRAVWPSHIRPGQTAPIRPIQWGVDHDSVGFLP